MAVALRWIPGANVDNRPHDIWPIKCDDLLFNLARLLSLLEAWQDTRRGS